jgi:SAM-dependent methyltransferase
MIANAATHGITVIETSVEDYADKAGRHFDAVALSAVMEHVVDPDALLGAVATLTRPGAVLYIDVPREPNIVTMIDKIAAAVQRSKRVLNLSPTFSPFHVYGFNPKALAALLMKHYFRIEHLEVRAAPRVPHRGSLGDRLVATGASVLIRLGNLTRTAPNMTAWGRRIEPTLGQGS